jgi:uncharacterized protein YkwD
VADVQTTDRLPPLRRRDLRAYREGTVRRRSRRHAAAVVASVLGVALLAVVAPPVLNGDTPAEAVAALPTRIWDLGDLAARGADLAARGADVAIVAFATPRDGGGGGGAQPRPSPSAMAAAGVREPFAAAQTAVPISPPATASTVPQIVPQIASSATASATASATTSATASATASDTAPAALETAPPAAAPQTGLQAPQVGLQAAAPSVDAAAAVPAASPTTALGPTLTADEQLAARLVTLTNAERAKAGLVALTPSPCATAQAAARAAVLVAEGRFEHDPLGPVLAACGASSAGENLALGYPTPEAMTAGWMASPGHRENILRASTSIGIGCVTGSKGVLCSQVFLG